MNSIVRTIAVPACVVAIGAVAIFWNLHGIEATKRELANEARVAQLHADQGDAKAEYDLGRMYLWGRGVPQDYIQAGYWYHKAADQGLAKANYAIGDLYYYGDGVPQSDSDALIWYHKAADRGDAVAQDAIGLMYYYGRGVPQSYPEAMAWYQKAASLNYAKAEYDIGLLYWYGLGVPRNLDEANRWYQKAALHGDRLAQQTLGTRFRPLGAVGNVLIATYFLGGVLLLSGLSSPRRFLKDPDQRQFLPAGILCIAKAVLTLFSHSSYCLFPSVWAAMAFQFTISFLGGVIVALCVGLIWRKGNKPLLVASVLLIFATTAAFFAIARFNMQILSAFRWRILVCEASLLGTALTATYRWWRSTRERQSSPSDPPSKNIEAQDAV